MAHEGCQAYSGDKLRPIPELRDCFPSKEAHNNDAVVLIKNATDGQLHDTVIEAVKLAYTLYQIPENFEWVLTSRTST